MFSSLVILPFLLYFPCYPAGHCFLRYPGADTIGRMTDRHYKREVKEWKRHESEVIDRYLQLVQLQEELSKEGQTEDGVLNERIRRLKVFVPGLDRLESDDSTYYIIRKVSSELGTGGTIYNPRTGEVEFGIQDGGNSTYSFVHEVTHGMQFMRGEMVFDRDSGASVGDDIGDELEAYKNQFAYDTGSVSGIHSFEAMDSVWLRGLKDREGVFIYGTEINGRYNVIGLKTVTVDSDIRTLREAYPAIKEWGTDLFPLKDKAHFIFRGGRPRGVRSGGRPRS